jgi:hypothetical protein
MRPARELGAKWSLSMIIPFIFYRLILRFAAYA